MEQLPESLPRSRRTWVDLTVALLKDEIDPDVVELLAGALHEQHAEFDTDAFTQAVTSELETLELKGRVSLIADTIAEQLPSHYLTALAIVVRVAETDIDQWAAWPLCSFVERHGTVEPEASLAAMSTLTKRWSCEFAIRPFLDEHLDIARRHMRRWTTDDDETVRRLPAEGSRPLLPWGSKIAALIEDPQIGIEIITALRHDSSETVRRSVANHLNDVAKLQPDLVVDILESWATETDPVDEKMVRHALRTLVKEGHRRALELLGFTTDPQISVTQFSCTPALVCLGGHIELTATLASNTDDEQHLVVDFVVHHVNSSGATSPKVFKWTNLKLAPLATVELTKLRRIQPASTRTYHPGFHRVDLQISGRSVATTQFDLTTD